MVKNNKEIEFPTDWSYRLIIEVAKEDCYENVLAVLKEHGVEVEPEKKSKSSCGRFQAYRIPVVFHSQEMMDKLSSQLSSVDGVKFLL